jgi:hypothetical protein
MALVYFCTLTPPLPLPALIFPPTITLHSLSFNLSVRGVGGVVASPPEPKPPPQAMPSENDSLYQEHRGDRTLLSL